MKSSSRLEIERAAYYESLTLWNQRSFQEQRLGQAFYNYFHLHKLTNHAFLDAFYESDGEKALSMISSIFEIR